MFLLLYKITEIFLINQNISLISYTFFIDDPYCYLVFARKRQILRYTRF